MPEGREVPEEVPLDREKGSRGDLRSHKAASVMLCGHVSGGRVRLVVDTWTNMVYWRGVKAALAVGRDSFQPIIPL